MKCLNCKKRERKKHFNSKYCERCSSELRSKPKSTLTKSQINKAKKLIGKMPRDEIAKELKTSVSNLKRAKVGYLYYKNYKYRANPKLVQRVCKFYEKHGLRKTQEEFPDITVRSLIERYPQYRPRQIRWTDEQIIDAVKMAGFVSFDEQSKYFNRPGAKAGSIKKLWISRLSGSPMAIHGLSGWNAQFIVDPKCPHVKTPSGISLYLWVDLENHLLPEMPQFLHEAVSTLATFQRKLYGVKNVRREILTKIVHLKSE